MRIAFCDDDMEIIKNYDDFANKINEIIPTSYDNYMSGPDLIQNYDRYNTFDIVFLDIELGSGSFNGIETAKKLREIDDNILIVFATSHTEYVYESFNVEPFRFVVKPIEYSKFKNVIIAANAKIQKNNNSLYIVSEKTTHHISIDDIYFIESNKRVLTFHFKREFIKSYGKLDDYAQKLYAGGFVLVHKSFLVNFNHMSDFDSDSLKLQNGVEIPISRNRRKYVKEEHVKFILRRYGKA